MVLLALATAAASVPAGAVVELATLTPIGPPGLTTTFAYAGFNRVTAQTAYRATLTNAGASGVEGTLYLAVTGITSTAIAVANADETATTGEPLFVALHDGVLAPGESKVVTVLFQGPSRPPRFSFASATYLAPRARPDTTPPAIAIVAPADGSVVPASGNPPAVQVTYSDAESGVDPSTLAFRLDGAPMALSCTTRTNGADCTSGVRLPDGARVLEARVADQAGNVGVATVAFEIEAKATDSTPPDVAILAPADGSVVPDSGNPPAIRLSLGDAGSGVDFTSIELTVNGTVVSASCLPGPGVTECIAAAPFPLGSIVLVASVRDLAGNLAEAESRFTIEAVTGDVVPPTLRILAPPGGSLVLTGLPAVQISYTDASGIDTGSLTFTVNGAARAFTCTLAPESAVCTPDAALPDGDVTLSAAVNDNAGNTGSDQIAFRVDTQVPEIAILSPAEGLITRESQVQVTGTAGTGVEAVSVNGVPAVLAGAQFSVTVPLREGRNMIVAVGTRASGRTGTRSVDVTRDVVAPIVRIDSPANGFVSASSTIAVTGQVNDIVTGGIDPRVFVNGREATVAGASFMVTDVPLVRGPNLVRAVARDFAGNESSHSVQVTFQQPAGLRLGVVSGNGQSAPVNSPLAAPFVASVTDALGNPVAGRTVRFEVTRNSGRLGPPGGGAAVRVLQAITDGSGRAAASFTLGDTAGEGNNRVQASAVGVAGQVEYCATGLPAAPAKILTVMGDNQRGVLGQPLAAPLEALVVDRDGNPIGGLAVEFRITRGNGNLDGQPSIVKTTGSNGIARAALTLGTEPGINNNGVTATFPGLTALAASFTASALAPGNPADTRFTGVVLDNAQTPIPGAVVSIPGTGIQALTDARGTFLLTGVPVGAIHLHIDPTGSPRPETFPPLEFETVTVAGQLNTLGQPILLPAIDTVSSRIVGGNQDVVLKMPDVAGLELTVFANSVSCPDGGTQCRVSISQVHLDKVPMPPPSGTFFMPPAWTIQPAGVLFDPPARISIPNDGLPPGRVIDIFQFDHTLNEFINVGKGTVSADGFVIVSDPGFGITRAGWGGCGQPQPPQTCASSCDDNNSCTTDACVNGACVYTPLANGTMCDDGNACTGQGMCMTGMCGDGPPKGNLTGSDADKAAWAALVKSCQGMSDTMKAICNDPGYNAIPFDLGRNQPNVLVDDFAANKVDLADLAAIDAGRCAWSSDSCQNIIHFARERLNRGSGFNAAHQAGINDENAYRAAKGRSGRLLSAVMCGSNACLNYDDNADGTTDRTEKWNLNGSDITGIMCTP